MPRDLSKCTWTITQCSTRKKSTMPECSRCLSRWPMGCGVRPRLLYHQTPVRLPFAVPSMAETHTTARLPRPRHDRRKPGVLVTHVLNAVATWRSPSPLLPPSNTFGSAPPSVSQRGGKCKYSSSFRDLLPSGGIGHNHEPVPPFASGQTFSLKWGFACMPQG